jgi:hypothetical protein
VSIKKALKERSFFMKKFLVVLVSLCITASAFAQGLSPFEQKILNAGQSSLQRMLENPANRPAFILVNKKFSSLSSDDATFKKAFTAYFTKKHNSKPAENDIVCAFARLVAISEVGAAKLAPGAQTDAVKDSLTNLMPIMQGNFTTSIVDTTKAIMAFGNTISQLDTSTLVGDCWMSKVVQEATDNGDFMPTYTLAEFFSNGTATISKYEGSKAVKVWKGRYSKTTVSWTTDKYHGFTYQLRNGLLYLYALDSANRRVRFEPFQKAYKE